MGTAYECDMCGRLFKQYRRVLLVEDKDHLETNKKYVFNPALWNDTQGVKKDVCISCMQDLCLKYAKELNGLLEKPE